MPVYTRRDLEDKDKTRLSEIMFNSKKLEIFSFILENRDEKLTISEINENVEASRPLVSEFLSKLRDLGIIDKERKGNLYLVKINEKSPYIDPLSEILKIDSEPLKIAAEELAEDLMNSEPALSEYIYSIYLFGSVARGTPGIKSDIDLLLLTQGKDENGTKQNRIEGKIWQRGEKLHLSFAPTFYGKEEFQNDIAREVTFTQKIREEGVLLAGEDLF